MTDYVLPPLLDVARIGFRYIDSVGITRGVYTGVPQTTSYGGDRIGASVEFTPAGGASAAAKAKRRQLLATLMQLRGKTNRIYLTDTSYVRGGSFPATELYTNSDFSSGTTGWATSVASLSVSDAVMRLSMISATAGADLYQQPAVTQYAPYALRAIHTDGARTSGIGAFVQLSDGTFDAVSTTTRGYLIASQVSHAASVTAYAALFSGAGAAPQVFLHVPFASLARCILVDGGGNLLQRSNALGTAPWVVSAGSTAGLNGTSDPNGTLTAQFLMESNTANVEHYTAQPLTVASSASDYTIEVSAKSSTRNWLLLRFFEATGSSYVSAWFNVSAGTLGTLTTGANWSGSRVTITSQGGGWFRCTLTARKTNAATSISAVYQSANADNVTSYAGTASAVAILLFEASTKVDSVPYRSTPTTSAAIAAGSQFGVGLYVKGLPVSSTGLLLAGDWVEIDGQLKMVTASLDTDAAGLGWLQFSSPLRRAVADNTPVIVHKPMGRFMFSGDDIAFMNEPGVQSTAVIELEEAFG